MLQNKIMGSAETQEQTLCSNTGTPVGQGDKTMVIGAGLFTSEFKTYK